MSFVRPLLCGALSLALLLSSCATPITPPDLRGIYQIAAQQADEDRNPVVLIPGILGSRIEARDGTQIWGAFSGRYADPSDDDGARSIALPMARGVPLDQLRHDHIAPGALDRVQIRFLGLPIVMQAYAQILGVLGVGGYRDEEIGRAGGVDYGDDHYTCFQFAYDWRRDLVENARILAAYLDDREAYVRREHAARGRDADGPIRFDIVAHSMGGLVLRYYLRYGTADLPADGSLPELTWAGAKRVSRAIMIGTPNAGSVDALRILTEGHSIGPFLPRYKPALLGTMPAVYQLLPRGRHGWIYDRHGDSIEDLLSFQLWKENGWGLADPENDRELARLFPDVEDPAERRAIALDHLEKVLTRAAAFQAALDRPAKRPEGLEIILFAGDAIDTPETVEVGSGRDPFRVTGYGRGDKVVLRSSALMDERPETDRTMTLVSPVDWSQVFFLFTEHLEMTRDPVFADNLLYLLLEAPRGAE